MRFDPVKLSFETDEDENKLRVYYNGFFCTTISRKRAKYEAHRVAMAISAWIDFCGQHGPFLTFIRECESEVKRLFK